MLEIRIFNIFIRCSWGKTSWSSLWILVCVFSPSSPIASSTLETLKYLRYSSLSFQSFLYFHKENINFVFYFVTLLFCLWQLISVDTQEWVHIIQSERDQVKEDTGIRNRFRVIKAATSWYLNTQSMV